VQHRPDAEFPRLDFAGRQALVTGAARGIGLAISNQLRGLGADVIAIDNDEGALRGAFPRGECRPLLADLATADTVALADRVLADHGAIPLIVNNVGITTPNDFLDLDAPDFDLVFRTNLRGPWFLTRQLARALVSAGIGGSILFISSVHDTHLRLNPHYSSSKAAVAMLVKELAYELAPHKIRVNAISPGWIKTHETDPAQERARAHQIPAGRPGTPDDIARMAAVLLSDELAGYVTGANLKVDGGLSLHSWLMDL
jgi:NAD(P)-dependent dehydrogenase (short-subunit alcohol dehydrogenase family)